MPRPNALQRFDPPVQLKLSALWASAMLCYIYGDYFGLFVPGTLTAMFDGQMGSLGPTTQGVLLGTAALITFPALMVALSLLLPPTVNRWLNMVLGLAYTAIVVFFMAGGWGFTRRWPSSKSAAAAGGVVCVEVAQSARNRTR